MIFSRGALRLSFKQPWLPRLLMPIEIQQLARTLVKSSIKAPQVTHTTPEIVAKPTEKSGDWPERLFPKSPRLS